MFAFPFPEKTLELVATNYVPAAGMHAHQEVGVGGILHATGVGVDVVAGAEDGGGHWEHGVFDSEDGFFAIFFQGGEDEAILTGEQVEDRDGLQAARDYIRKRVGDDDGNDNLIVATDFENHEDGSHRDAKKSGEEDTHADQSIGSSRAGGLMKEDA